MTDVKKLTKEVMTMLSFDHPNVMSLIGVCLNREMPLLIMPFMTNGSVLEYVKHNKEEFLLTSEATEAQVGRQKEKQCMYISQCMHIYYSFRSQLAEDYCWACATRLPRGWSI